MTKVDMLPRATSVFGVGQWSGEPADTVVLDFDSRHRRRIAMIGERGLRFLLDLAQAARLKHGDALMLDDGRRVAVIAAREPLAEVRCDDSAALVRIAWHIGNRHLAAMMEPDRLLIRRDHVIEDMVRGLGATVTHIEAPFEPEGGAYASGGQAHHGHD